LNLEILKKVMVTLLLLAVGVFLIRAYWTGIISAVLESWKMLTETRIRYVILAFLVYLLSVYLFASRWQKVLSCIDYNLKAADLFPILFGEMNNLTPANRKGDEPLRIFWANKRFGISYTDSFITFLFEKNVSSLISCLIGFSLPLLLRRV